MLAITIVFVHGWSVTNLDAYGNLPERLRTEGLKNDIDIDVKEIFLGRYISFHDEVRLPDISRAFNAALRDQTISTSTFICITHSTGGPVMRDWWNSYCRVDKQTTRMSHLIMLAPANFGSALAQLGKGTLSRMDSWLRGVEPGQGVLDWLALGSPEAWSLNMEWITDGQDQIGPKGFFPFVLTGQSIDRKLYDILNSYTGETGSDGVVRVAAANMQFNYVRLVQQAITKQTTDGKKDSLMDLDEAKNAPDVPMRIISNKSHSGKTMGIMNSVGANDIKSNETVQAIFDCIKVSTMADYNKLFNRFITETAAVQEKEKVEVEERGILLSDRIFIHDRYTMVIFKVVDTQGYAVNDYDLLLTVGKDNDPNHLPEGFFIDRQQNKLNKNTITYYLNYDLLQGSAEIKNDNDEVIRPETKGIDMLGIILQARPNKGFVRYIDCVYNSSKELFSHVLNPNSTTMVEIVLQRNVDKEVFRLETEPPLLKAKSFKSISESGDFIS